MKTTIYEVWNLLNEYDNSGNLMTLAIGGGKKAKGKNLDNIAAGKTKPYKTDSYKTKHELAYPALGKMVQNMKNNKDALKGDKIVTGRARSDLDTFMWIHPLKKDEEGLYILPFGDNIRLKQVNKTWIMSYKDPNDQNQATVTPAEPVNDIKTDSDQDITKMPIL